MSRLTASQAVDNVMEFRKSLRGGVLPVVDKILASIDEVSKKGGTSLDVEVEERLINLVSQELEELEYVVEDITEDKLRIFWDDE